MTRSPKSRQRARPVAVELRGSSKCLQDRDRRYANARWTTLFGLEVTSIKRVDENVDHYGRWRGTGVVTAVRPFEFDYVRYFRVTLSVVPTAQKAQLRGTSSAVDLVDILVRDEHEHAPRFRHVGQRLLVEAEVCSQTSVLRESHPDLEGLDDEMKERLRILREGILLATMGEFPDERPRLIGMTGIEPDDRCLPDDRDGDCLPSSSGLSSSAALTNVPANRLLPLVS